MKSSKGRQYVLQQSLTEALARAVVDMDDIAFSEGLGPTTVRSSTAWIALLDVAEEVADKEADSTRHRHYCERQES